MPPLSSNDPNLNAWLQLGDMMPNASYDPSVSGGPQPQPNANSNQPPDPLLTLPPGRAAYGMGGPNSHANFSNFDALMKQLQDQGLSSMNTQQDQLKKLNDYVSKLPDSAQSTDLTGLNALADAWGDNGSSFAKDYIHPATTAQMQAAKAQAQEKVDSLQNGLSKDQLSLLKDQLSSELQKQGIEAHWGMINAMKGNQMDDKVTGQLQGDMLKDKNYVAAQGMVNDGQKIHQLLLQASTSNPDEVSRRFAASQLKVAIARFNTGGQRINVPEINAATSDPDWQTRWNQAVETASGQGLDPTNAQSMGAYIDTVLGNAQDTLANYQYDYANKLRARTSYDGSTAYQKITGTPYQPKQAQRTAPKLLTKDPSTMTRAEKLQYLQGQ